MRVLATHAQGATKHLENHLVSILFLERFQVGLPDEFAGTHCPTKCLDTRSDRLSLLAVLICRKRLYVEADDAGVAALGQSVHSQDRRLPVKAERTIFIELGPGSVVQMDIKELASELSQSELLVILLEADLGVACFGINPDKRPDIIRQHADDSERFAHIRGEAPARGLVELGLNAEGQSILLTVFPHHVPHDDRDTVRNVAVGSQGILAQWNIVAAGTVPVDVHIGVEVFDAEIDVVDCVIDGSTTHVLVGVAEIATDIPLQLEQVRGDHGHFEATLPQSRLDLAQVARRGFCAVELHMGAACLAQGA